MVYPIYLRGYREQVAKFFSSAIERPRMLSFGRQGLFSYSNTDHVMMNAFDAADLILSRPLDEAAKRTFYSSHKAK